MNKKSSSYAAIVRPVIKEVLSDGEPHTREEIVKIVQEQVGIDSGHVQNVLSYMNTKDECVRLSRGVYCIPYEVVKNNLDEKVVLELYEKFYNDCLSYIESIDLWSLDKKDFVKLVNTKKFCQKGLSQLRKLWR